MVEFEFNNKTNFRFPRKQAQTLLDLTSRTLKIKKEQELSVAFVSSSEMKKLNHAWRAKNKVTDVLSFETKEKFPGETNYFGEIIICPEQAKTQAKEFSAGNFNRELLRLLLHGYLHLNGFDHIKTKDAKKMEALEQKIMRLY